MKIKCPICNCDGLLQQRGNSYRIQHYRGFADGKRSYLYHSVSNLLVKQMEVNYWKQMTSKLAPLLGLNGLGGI